MNVSLTWELERFVNEKVSSGLYTSASEVVREALRLLCERDKLAEAQMGEVRRKVAEGLEQLRRGEVVAPSQLRADLHERSRARRRK